MPVDVFELFFKNPKIGEARARCRQRQREKQYGLASGVYEQMLVAQHGVCAVCRRPEPLRQGKRKPLSVDHDHRTGKVRALLCGRCNTSLGLLHESPDIMRRLIHYVLKHRQEQLP